MSDESGTFIILLKLKTILFTWRYHNIGPNTHTLKGRNEDVMYGHNGQLPGGPTSK